MARARILVADDHSTMRERVSCLLSEQFDVVGKAADGLAAVDMAAWLRPDLAVFDISMPGMTGLEAAARLAEIGVSLPVVFLSLHEDQEFVDAARSAGALGYVLKRNIGTDLLPVVRRALRGLPTFRSPAALRERISIRRF